MVTATAATSSSTTNIRGYEVPNDHIIDAARTYFDVIHSMNMPDICFGCEAKIHDSGDWDIPEAWGCPCDFAPYDECCPRHERIFDIKNILDMAFETFAEVNCIEC